jgi:hypothetical protein
MTARNFSFIILLHEHKLFSWLIKAVSKLSKSYNLEFRLKQTRNEFCLIGKHCFTCLVAVKHNFISEGSWQPRLPFCLGQK